MSVANEKVKLMNEVCDDYFCNMAKFFPVIEYRDDMTGLCVCDLCCHEYPCNKCVYGGEQ